MQARQKLFRGLERTSRNQKVRKQGKIRSVVSEARTKRVGVDLNVSDPLYVPCRYREDGCGYPAVGTLLVSS